jgi:hypothetical protein
MGPAHAGPITPELYWRISERALSRMDDDEPITYYFGQRWDAPLLDGRIQQLDAPVGHACLWCHQPIMDTDRGLFRAAISDQPGQDGQPGTAGTVEPVHMECDLRAALGNLTHLQGRCGHIGDCNDQETGTWREQARAVLDHLNQQRAMQGMEPM